MKPLNYRIYSDTDLVACLGHPKAAARVAEMYGAGTTVTYMGNEIARISVTGQRVDWLQLTCGSLVDNTPNPGELTT